MHVVRSLAALCAAGALLAVAAPPVAATGMVVNTLVDLTSDVDGKCTLREAIKAANTNAASGATRGECPAGGGADTITFSVKGTVNLVGKLPDLTSAITIDGAGAITIVGDGANGIFLNDTGATSTFRGLTLTDGNVLYGGAILNAGTLTVTETTITGNVAADWGGGIVNASNATLVVRDSTISGNSAVYGGGIYVGGSTASVTVIRSTISGNSASGAGGGIYAEGKTTLANVTLAGNTAPNGAGIYLGQATSSLTMLNSTVTANHATAAGGGIAEGSPSVVVRNSIVAGNTAGTSNPNLLGAFNTSLNNLVDVDAATLLDPLGLQDNGGPTKTYGLLPAATAAIDKGDAATCSASPVSGLDQRSLARPAACDIGAVERDKSAPTATAPKTSLRSSTGLVVNAIPVKVSWTGTDNATGSGIDHYVLARSVNGDAYAVVSSSLATPAAYTTLDSGKTYRFRVSAVDNDGNAGGWVYGPTLKPTLIQQANAAFHYAKAWSTQSLSAFSGGSTKWGKAAGASVTWTFTGRGAAFVTSTAPTRGRAKVYVDGSLKTTIDLGTPEAFRFVAWSSTWASSATHTVKIVLIGTSGRPRVDVDAFIVLK